MKELSLTSDSEISDDRVKSGKFGHTLANSGNPDETAPRVNSETGKFGHTFANSGNPDIFTVCFVNLFFTPIIKM